MQARGLSASLRPVQQAAQQGRSHRRVAAISLARSGAAGATAKLLSLGGYGSLQQRFHAPLRAQRPVAARPLREPARLGRVAVASSAASVNASDAGKKDGPSTAQTVLMTAAFFGCLAWAFAHPTSPLSGVPEVVFVRSLLVGIFWKLVDNIYNPLHFATISACNAVIFLAYKILPVIQTVPDILLLATTEIGGLVLDVSLVLLAALKALVLKTVYFAAIIIEKLFGWFPSVEARLEGSIMTLLSMIGEDALKWAVAIMMYRPFESLAALLLTTSKLVIQFAMEVVEYACAAIYAAPAIVGFLLIPAVYVALAVYRRSRRIVVEEPQLTYSVAEFEGKVAQLQPLVVPPLPIAEATAEAQIGQLMSRVTTELQPLTVPPLPVAEMAALSAATEARARADIAASKRTVVNINTSTVIDARNKKGGAASVSSSSTLTGGLSKSMTTTTTTSTSSNVRKVQEESGQQYDGFEAVRQAANSFRSTVSNLPTIADVAMTAEERLSAEKALLAAQQALQAAESAFYASPEGQAAAAASSSSSVTSSTTTSTTSTSGSSSSSVASSSTNVVSGAAKASQTGWGAAAAKPSSQQPGSKGPTRMPPPQAAATSVAVTAPSPEELRASAAARQAAPPPPPARPAVTDANAAAKQFKAAMTSPAPRQRAPGDLSVPARNLGRNVLSSVGSVFKNVVVQTVAASLSTAADVEQEAKKARGGTQIIKRAKKQDGASVEKPKDDNKA